MLTQISSATEYVQTQHHSLVFIHAKLNMPSLTAIYRVTFPAEQVEIHGVRKSLHTIQKQQREKKKERLKREDS